MERLRREAQRRGIKLGPGSASEPDIVVEPQPEPKSVTEAKLRAKLQAKKKANFLRAQQQNAEQLGNDNGAPGEQIPPIPENKQQEGAGQMSGDTAAGTTGKKKRKGKKGQQAKQQQQFDAINSSIREKLASIAARKERMHEIRAQLVRPVVDETFRKAEQQLNSITEMRKLLEEVQDKGEQLPEETAQMLERQLEAEESGVGAVASAAAALPDSEIPFAESIQFVTKF
ncbi:unnamed protein product [Gongylonema pulchrum]|uniref:Uncharacterized protein n=1 Tax=Gongylonema pulchrum TaxID=637853 RepID=A0A3P7NJZ0_9BILA|nr:unnamed protein product [Gongylonema pulchrum]